MHYINLTQGKYARIDACDYDFLKNIKWHARSSGRIWYAAHTYRKHPGKGGFRTKLMHRLILKATNGTEIDHINGDGLDNRRCNLRFCSKSQNHQNETKRINGLSQFKGVKSQKNRWIARIQEPHKQKRTYLGCFKTEKEAALAYDMAAKECFGEFARLNFPPKEL